MGGVSPGAEAMKGRRRGGRVREEVSSEGITPFSDKETIHFSNYNVKLKIFFCLFFCFSLMA